VVDGYLDRLREVTIVHALDVLSDEQCAELCDELRAYHVARRRPAGEAYRVSMRQTRTIYLLGLGYSRAEVGLYMGVSYRQVKADVAAVLRVRGVEREQIAA